MCKGRHRIFAALPRASDHKFDGEGREGLDQGFCLLLAEIVQRALAVVYGFATSPVGASHSFRMAQNNQRFSFEQSAIVQIEQYIERSVIKFVTEQLSGL